MAPVISEATRGRIVGLSQAGKSVEEIIELTNCCESTVRRWIARWRDGGDEALEDSRKDNGRPKGIKPKGPKPKKTKLKGTKPQCKEPNRRDTFKDCKPPCKPVSQQVGPDSVDKRV